ncbi:hypothetical protein CCR75_005812 [Bremia lactucae]|uniref:Uncharacterized protein n=1 Tax=Bremia lactucae TaxID=4779 RepID=A0A976FNH8_BRELC|nr:hypothetical protein CCR75_005812 [Bremia lactucae]
MKNPDIAKDYNAFYHKIDKKVQIITKMDIEKQLRHFVEMAEDLDKDVLSDPWDPYELLQAIVSKYDLAMIITASQKNEPSETIVDNAAMKMFKQFHASIKMGTFEDLVDLLKLHKIAQEKDTLFSSLEWACLLDHIDQVKNNRFVIVDTIKFLKQYFDMEALVSLFPTIGKDSRTRHIIQPLVDDLATLVDNKNPEEVLRILHFGVENSQPEDITLFCMRAKVWMSFVTSYRKTIGNSFSAMKSLRKVYGDKKLAAMLAKAENTPGFRELAKHLQDEFLRALLNHDLPIENIKNKRPTTRAKPVADDSSLQTLLSDYHALRRDIHNMLRMPQEMTLEGLSGTIETVENWYNVGPNLEHLSKYSILRTRFGESEIADLVKRGRNSHLKNIQKMASTIYHDQISCNFSPETTSQILYQGSNKDLDFSSKAQLVTLQTHINSFNAYYPNSDRTLYTVLKDLTGDDEKAIIQEFIISAGEFSDEIPLQLWKEQMQRWINRELDPSIAFEMLPTMPVRKWPVFFKVQYLVHYLTHFNAATSKSRLEIKNLYEIPDLKLTRRDNAPSLFLENSMLVVVSHVLGIPKDQTRKWLRHISFLSSENPTFKIEWDSVTVLRCFFPDDKLKLKLQKVAADLRYEAHAKTLLNDLNQVLFKAHHDKITEYLSSTSNLKVEKKAFFAQPQMKFLSSDVELFNKLYPDSPTTLNAVLKAVLKEDDATFLQRVLSALDNDNSKEIVLRLYEEELQFWLKKKTPPTDFLNYLEGLDDLKFLIMVQYSFDFIQMIPKDDYAATITKMGAFEDAWKICTIEALRKEVNFDDAILIDKLEKFIEAKDTWNLKYSSGDKLPVKKNKQVTSAVTDTILNEFGVVKDSKKKLFLMWVKYIDALHGETSAFRIKLDSKTLARSFFTPAEEEAIKAVRRTKTNVSKRLR